MDLALFPGPRGLGTIAVMDYAQRHGHTLEDIHCEPIETLEVSESRSQLLPSSLSHTVHNYNLMYVLCAVDIL